MFFSVGLMIDWDADKLKAGEMVTVPDDIYQKGCVKTADEGLASANRIGFPVMIKASEGGGGKGIRKATNPEEFPNLFRQVGIVLFSVMGCLQDYYSHYPTHKKHQTKCHRSDLFLYFSQIF